MEKGETKKTTVKETPGEKKTTEETHTPGKSGNSETPTPRQPGQPSHDEKKTTTEKR
jgi:hypothetical protein